MNSTASQLTAYQRAVLVTLAYTDQFDHPLTFHEICVRCLRTELSEASLSEQKVHQALETLKKAQLIESASSVDSLASADRVFYFLSGREKIIQLRNERQAVAVKKTAEIGSVVSFLKRIPSIQAIYLTGSQAMNGADEQSDIDFMIVTLPRRLWMTRILVSTFAQLHGKRRSWNNEEAGSWCFNLWLDIDHLQVHPSKQDGYRAHEVLQAHELWSRNFVAERFLIENRWIEQYFFTDQKKKKSHRESMSTTLGESSRMFSPLFDGVDWVAWKLQSLYMKPHQTTEKVGRGYAFFHPRDTGKMIKDGWIESLERCLPKRMAAEILQPYVRTH